MQLINRKRPTLQTKAIM